MWVSYDNLWVCYAGSAALILFLYAAKAAALRYLRSANAAVAAFAVVVAACVPVTWALSPDWDNEHVLRVAIYVGSPVAILAVPCWSFLIDLSVRSAGHQSAWLWRIPMELVIVVPVWFYSWVLFECFVLGWVWI